MTEFNPHDDLPEEFRDVADRLRESRPTLSPIESDQLKLRAMSQAGVTAKRRRSPLVSRWVTLGLTTAILGGTAATGLANCGNFFGHGQNAASSQYQPGHPCDPQHVSWPYGSDDWSHPCEPTPPHHHNPPPPPPPPPHHNPPPPPPPPHHDPPPPPHHDPPPPPHHDPGPPSHGYPGSGNNFPGSGHNDPGKGSGHQGSGHDNSNSGSNGHKPVYF
jgi:hypothetical protein